MATECYNVLSITFLSTSGDSWTPTVPSLASKMCDSSGCQDAAKLENLEEETAEAENIILIITFLLLVCLVYVTGLIVWVWCNRNPDEGLNAVQQTDRLAMRSSSLLR